MKFWDYLKFNTPRKRFLARQRQKADRHREQIQTHAKNDICKEAECALCIERFGVYNTYNMYLNLHDVITDVHCLNRISYASYISLNMKDLNRECSIACKRRRLSSKPLYYLGQEDHLFAQDIENGFNYTFKMVLGLRNFHGVCQSYSYIINKLFLLAKNLTQNFILYAKDGAFKKPKLKPNRLYSVDVATMTSAQFEDIAIYALGGKNLVSPLQRPACSIAAIRERLYKKACKLATQHIKKYWHEFDVCNSITQNKRHIFIDWYIYICFLIKRQYDVNVFSGDGKDFLLAYVGNVNGVLVVSPQLLILFQSYTFFDVAPEGLKTYSIATQGEESRHKEDIFTDGICTVYSNNQDMFQVTVMGNETSYLAIACSAMWISESMVDQNEELDKCKSFALVQRNHPELLYFYDTDDFTGQVFIFPGY